MLKLYKKYRWAHLICLIGAIVSCVLPCIVAVFIRAPKMDTTEDKLALGGVSAFFAALIVFIVCKSRVKKFIAKIPFTLVVLFSLFGMLLLLVCLKRIIDDAIFMVFLGFCGATVGFVFEILAMHFNSEAEYAEERYRRGEGNV